MVVYGGEIAPDNGLNTAGIQGDASFKYGF